MRKFLNLFYLFLTLVMISNLVLIKDIKANSNILSSLSNDEIRQVLINNNIPITIRKPNGTTYEVNYDTLRQREKLVYGSPQDVPNNDYDAPTGEYRYLGYTSSNTYYNNIDFPPDAVGNNNVGTRNWIKDPWIKGIYNAKRTEFMDTPYTDSEMIDWLDRILDKYTGDGTTGGNWDAYGWTGSKLIDYAKIEQPPTDYAPGQITMWHETSGHIWYDSFILEEYKNIADLFKNTGDVPTLVLYESNTDLVFDTSNPRWNSSIIIGGYVRSNFEYNPDMQVILDVTSATDELFNKEPYWLKDHPTVDFYLWEYQLYRTSTGVKIVNVSEETKPLIGYLRDPEGNVIKKLVIDKRKEVSLTLPSGRYTVTFPTLLEESGFWENAETSWNGYPATKNYPAEYQTIVQDLINLPSN